MSAVAGVRHLVPASMRTPGALSIVLTPQGRIVLVRHTYTAGWYPPDGGRQRGEKPDTAVIRELREEIAWHG